MKKKQISLLFIFAIFLMGFGNSAYAQRDRLGYLENINYRHIYEEEEIAAIDWNLEQLQTNTNTKYKPDCKKSIYDPPAISEREYRERLAQLPTVIAMPYNSIVQKYIDTYLSEIRREKTEKIIGLSSCYFPMFEEALEAQEMPLELKYLAIVESALNYKAYSRAGASGLWQFMVGTGKMYGLTVNTLVDERRDPIKSTHAAVKYLKDLYKIYMENPESFFKLK